MISKNPVEEDKRFDMYSQAAHNVFDYGFPLVIKSSYINKSDIKTKKLVQDSFLIGAFSMISIISAVLDFSDEDVSNLCKYIEAFSEKSVSGEK